MTHSGAKVVLGGSVALLVAVSAAWFSGAGDASANLAGKAVRRSDTVRPSAAAVRRGDPRRSSYFPETVLATPPSPALPSESSPATSSTAATEAARQRRPTFPKRITIPSLGVNADVVSVGLETDGSMEIPGASEAGWYHYGPRPGDATGSAVLAGHVDHQKQPGVFIELRRIDLGSDIEVTDADGGSHRFRVTERFQIDKDELPAAELFRADGDPVLTLITCGGKFSSRSRHYADNIVIRATLLPDDAPRPEAGRSDET